MCLKELRRNILSRFFHGLNYGSSVGKPKINGLPRKKSTKRVHSKLVKRRRLKRIGNDDFGEASRLFLNTRTMP